MEKDKDLSTIEYVRVPNGEGNPILGRVELIDHEKQIAWIKLEGYLYRVSVPLCALREMSQDVN